MTTFSSNNSDNKRKKMALDRYKNDHAVGPRYKTGGFGTSVLEQMYKFYKEEQFCDFQIKVEDRIFKVHRLVFASSSDYFQAMLSHDMMETREESTCLKGMTLKGIEPLIEYVYTGSLDINLDNTQDVIAGATFLQISSAIDLCVRFLKENMTFDNAEELLKIGELFSVPALREYYRNFLLKNFLKFVESETFLRTSAEMLADYLSDDALLTSSECVLFHHCIQWYEHDRKARAAVAYKVFENIRMCVDGMPLIHQASSHDLFHTNKKCGEILEFNRNYIKNARKGYIMNSTHRTRVRSTRKTIVQVGGVMEVNEDYDSFRDMMTQPTNEPFGWNMNHYFHPDLKSWFPLGKEGHLKHHRMSHQRFVEVNGEGVIIGGYEYIVTGDNVSKMAVKDVKMLSAQGSFDLRNMPKLQHERARHAAVFYEGCIYVIGGKDDKKALKSVERLDCLNEKWSYAKPIPRKIYDHAAAVCQDQIYVTGGSQYMAIDARKTVWCYAPRVNNWKKKSDMKCARSGHGMACLDGTLYVCGGYNGTREAGNPELRCLVSVEQYNVATDQWTKLSAMTFGICFFEMTVLDNRLVVMGGIDSEGRITQYMHEYIQGQDKWKVFGELVRPLKNACCGAVTVKLTEFGCMEDDSDEYLEKYQDVYDQYELAHMSEDERRSRLRTFQMMENFEPGDYMISDESDAVSDDSEYYES